jgi:hypothetical protein
MGRWLGRGPPPEKRKIAGSVPELACKLENLRLALAPFHVAPVFLGLAGV